MVILRYGGVYADKGIECRKPLDSVIRPADTMVVGWEWEGIVTPEGKGIKHKQALQRRFFAAAPGHPVLREVCNGIATAALADREVGSAIDGSGLFTDIVLRHAAMQPSKGQVRMKPILESMNMP